MAQENRENTGKKQDEEEKIVLTKEEIAEARKMIKSVISTKEKVAMYGLACVAAVTDVVGRVLPQFASAGYKYLGGKIGTDYVNANTQNLFMSVSQYIYDKISYKMIKKLLKEYDTRPEMDQNLLNPDKTANNIYEMANKSGHYMVQNAKKVLGLTNVGFGVFLTIGSLSVATPVLPASLLATSATVLGGSAVIGFGQHLLQRKLKTEKVENKEVITERRNSFVAYVRQMLTNSQMRAKTLSDDKSYMVLEQKTQAALAPSRSFLWTLGKYFSGLKGIETAATGAVFAGALLVKMPIAAAVALTSGVSTTISSLNGVSSAFLGVDEQKESFARRLRRFRSGIKDFAWGKDNINTNANVLQIDNITYRFRNRDENSERFGEYGDKTAFTTKEDIRFAPGITLLSGASGAGKSTLIRLFNQADYVTEGVVRIGTTNENGNFVGQDYRDLKHLEINKNIAFSESQPQISTETVDEYITRGNPNADKHKIEEIKNLLGIISEEPEKDENGKSTGKMKPRTLDTISPDSAGERTRLSIAQALIKDSPIMIFDEPTSGVDPATSEKIINHIKKLGEEGKTIIFTTHKPEDIELLKPYQAVDIGLHVRGQKGNDIKKFDLTTPRNLEHFVEFFKKRQLAEKRAQEEKTKVQVTTHMDHARNLVRKRMNEGTNFAKDEKTGNVITNGIPEQDLMTYKQIKGKSEQDARRETAELFAKIGRGGSEKGA